MKLFISWSGDLSREIALVFRDWLPSVIQSITPYVSSEDIEKGARWSSDISNELQASSYGILCVTRENINAPWINFEAGALSKAVDTSRVSPFLLGLKRTEISGPLVQFQSTIYERDDLKKLVFTLNSIDTSNQLTPQRLEDIFDVWWPRLEGQLDPLQAQTEIANPTEETPARNPNEILEEILELTRSQQKILLNPIALFPPEYINSLLRLNSANDLDIIRTVSHLLQEWNAFIAPFKDINLGLNGETSVSTLSSLYEHAIEIEKIILSLERQIRRKSHRRDTPLSVRELEIYRQILSENAYRDLFDISRINYTKDDNIDS